VVLANIFWLGFSEVWYASLKVESRGGANFNTELLAPLNQSAFTKGDTHHTELDSGNTIPIKGTLPLLQTNLRPNAEMDTSLEAILKKEPT